MGRKIFTAAFLILLAGTAASAIPLTYIESVSGDLAGQTLAFDVGINSVFGRQGLTNPITPVTVFDLDFFLFSLPAGTQLTHLHILFWRRVGLSREDLLISWTMMAPFLFSGRHQ